MRSGRRSNDINMRPGPGCENQGRAVSDCAGALAENSRAGVASIPLMRVRACNHTSEGSYRTTGEDREEQMIVQLFTGRGRRTRKVEKPRNGSMLFRLFMAWFSRGNIRSD